MASHKNSRFRFLLYGLASHYLGLALLLALLFLNPPVVSSQTLSAGIGWFEQTEPQVYQYWVCNSDWNAFYGVQLFQLSELPVDVPGAVAPPGWWAYAYGNGITWVNDSNPIYPGECLGGFTFWVPVGGWGVISYLISGFNDSQTLIAMDYVWGPQ